MLEEIGQGRTGIVFKARKLSLNRVVAVKFLDVGPVPSPAGIDRFRREATSAAAVSHPNLVAIHEVGEVNGQPFFSMDYVAGRDLAEVVGNHPLPARRVAIYLRKIARAVQYAHDHGIVHRDLKPANILIDEQDEPRVTDFGFARCLLDDPDLTLTNQVLGSPDFMPPEQRRGGGQPAGPAGDLYSLGAVFYFLLTARPPFAADSFEGTLARVLSADPVPPRPLNPSIPRELEALCLKCLEQDPDRRLSSAGTLADELERFLEGQSIRSGSVDPLDR